MGRKIDSKLCDNKQRNFNLVSEKNTNKKSEPDFYVGNSPKKVLPSIYKKWLGINRRNHFLKVSKNTNVRNVINQIYRPHSIIGDGGISSVLKFEKRNGLGLGKNGNTHIEKGFNEFKHINNILKDKNLGISDRKILTKIRNKIGKALAEVML